MTFNFKKKALFDTKTEQINVVQKQSDKLLQKNEKLQVVSADSFTEYDLDESILQCLTRLGYQRPTRIQAQTLINNRKGGDLLCLSETGSGKTLSYVLPILDFIAKTYQNSKIPYGVALIIVPTRELCMQVNEYFTNFANVGLKDISSAMLYGGVDPMKQVLEIAKKPHVIVATPGRILDHLQKTKGFHLNNIKFLILDEADKLLNKDFQEQLNQILSLIPQERRAFLFSATLTNRVDKLQRVSLKDPTRIQINSKYQTVQNLKQFYIFIPSKLKDCYLVYLLNKERSKKTIVFAQTRLGAERLSLLLNHLGFSVECLHGDMSQPQRVKSFSKFKEGQVKVLVTTDVAARGIDISLIEIVINYDLCDPKSYIHRVGRTARIGQKGKSITIVTQYDVQAFKKIEDKLQQKMQEFPTESKQAEIFLQKLELCHQQVSKQMKRKKKQSFFDKMQ